VGKTTITGLIISRLLAKKGHRVIVGCRSTYPAFRKAADYGLETAALDFYGYNPFKLLKNFIRMVALIRREKISIINAHRSEDQAFALLARLFTRARFIITRGDRRAISKGPFSRFKYKSADAVILTCQSLYDQNKAVLSGKNVRVIHGSVDQDHFRTTKTRLLTAKKYGIDPRLPVVGMAGRLDYVKDQFTFVNACGLVFRKFKKATFLIAGKQEHITAEELRHLAAGWNLRDNLVILPEVHDIADVISLFDIAVIISTGSETISRVLLEYLFLKKPVIGTNVNVIPEMIRPGVNGEVIKPGDYTDLAEKALSLLLDRKKRNRYGIASHSLYKKLYSEEMFYQETMKVFRSTL
jgi:glycosyltransferase involved in cell wall biosynthesis